MSQPLRRVPVLKYSNTASILEGGGLTMRTRQKNTYHGIIWYVGGRWIKRGSKTKSKSARRHIVAQRWCSQGKNASSAVLCLPARYKPIWSHCGSFTGMRGWSARTVYTLQKYGTKTPSGRPLQSGVGLKHQAMLMAPDCERNVRSVCGHNNTVV